MLRTLLVIAATYAIGCVAGAYYILRMSRGGDIRVLGSGTAGAHNMLRVAGRGAAAGTFLFDAARGAIAVLLARLMLDVEWAGALALLCVVVGHVWPAQLGFRGGKGLSPALGAMLAFDPIAVLIAGAAGATVGLVSRSVKVAALATVALVGPAAIFTGSSPAAALMVVATTLLILFAHHPSFDRIRPPITPGAGGSP